MRYYGPPDASDPNAHYVGKDVASQQQGSTVDPRAIECPQREIVNVITLSGQVPTDDKMTQLATAIRLATLQTFTDTSTTPGYISVGSALLMSDYTNGMPFTVTLNQDISGATLLNYGVLGPRQVVHNGGGALQRGDYRKGEVVEFRYNATNSTVTVLTPVSQALINEAVTKTIGGFQPDFKDFYEATTWLSRRRISYTGKVTFQHAAGVGQSKTVYAQDVRFNHPDQKRVAILGAPLNGSLPSASALAFTGVANRVADTNTNLNTMRSVFNTEIALVSGARLIVTGDMGLFQDFLITSDGSGPNKTDIFQYYGSDNLIFEAGTHNVRRVASFGAQQNGISTGAGANTSFGEQVYGLGCGFSGVTISGQNNNILPAASVAALANGVYGVQVFGALGCVDQTAQIYARGNVTSGISNNGGNIVGSNNSVSRDNGASNVMFVNCAKGNLMAMALSGSPIGIDCSRCSSVDAIAVTGSATDTAFRAFFGGVINRQGSSVTAPTQANPAVGTPGNGNAYIN